MKINIKYAALSLMAVAGIATVTSCSDDESYDVYGNNNNFIYIAPQDYSKAQFGENSWLFFGKETAGLPQWFREAHADRCIRIPMRPDARSLNLANSVAVITYEALRQLEFPQLSGEGDMKAAFPPSREGTVANK